MQLRAAQSNPRNARNSRTKQRNKHNNQRNNAVEVDRSCDNAYMQKSPLHTHRTLREHSENTQRTLREHFLRFH